jgi:hypothetical protein
MPNLKLQNFLRPPHLGAPLGPGPRMASVQKVALVFTLDLEIERWRNSNGEKYSAAHNTKAEYTKLKPAPRALWVLLPAEIVIPCLYFYLGFIVHLGIILGYL